MIVDVARMQTIGLVEHCETLEISPDGILTILAWHDTHFYHHPFRIYSYFAFTIDLL